jgi:hypothetical protein
MQNGSEEREYGKCTLPSDDAFMSKQRLISFSPLTCVSHPDRCCLCSAPSAPYRCRPLTVSARATASPWRRRTSTCTCSRSPIYPARSPVARHSRAMSPCSTPTSSDTSASAVMQIKKSTSTGINICYTTSIRQT